MSQLDQEKKTPPQQAGGGVVPTSPIEKAPAPAAPKPAKRRLTQAEKNAAFLKLPAADRRRAIAKDVKAQIAAGRYTPEHMVYVQANKGNLDKSLRGAMRSNDFDCAVCGVGSVFVSTMLLSGADVTLFDVVHEDFSLASSARGEIRGHFGPEQLALIELAFEGDGDAHFRQGCAMYQVTGESMDRALAFNRAHERGRGPDRPASLLGAIMDNIIEHGEFRP